MLSTRYRVVNGIDLAPALIELTLQSGVKRHTVSKIHGGL